MRQKKAADSKKGKRGDRAVDFEKVYLEYYDSVYRYVLSLCGEEDLAGEITQEAFFKALKHINSFRGECKLSVWLCQIAKNTYYTIAKQRGRQVDYPLEEMQSDLVIEQRLIDKDTAFGLHRLLHALEDPYKEVFWMRTFGELSFKEIGLLFGKTEGWARVTYHRAGMKIKEGVR